VIEPAARSSPAFEVQRRWWLPAALILLLGVIAALLWPTIASLVAQWENTDSLTYTHGYLIVLISAWLLWRAKPVAASVSISPNLRALPVLVVLSLLWLLAYRSGIEIGHQMLLPLLAWTAVYAALGREVAQRCGFAFMYLYFAVPVWDLGNEVLQAITVSAVRTILQLGSVPAYVVGNFVHIPAGVFEIAGGCSGLHLFIVAVAIAALYGELHKDTWRVRLLMLGLAVVLAMLSNWIRVSTIIIAGYLTDMQHYLVSVSHYYFGWAVFAVVMLAFFLIARRLPARQSEEGETRVTDRSVSPRRLVAGIGAAVVALSLGPTWSVLASNARLPLAPARLPASVSQWQAAPGADLSRWQPVYQGADLQDQVQYRSGDLRLTAYLAAYMSQQQGKELIGYGNSITGNLSAQVTATHKLESKALAVNEVLLTDKAGGRSVLQYYYRVGAHSTPRARTAQLLYGWQSLFSPPVAEVLAVYADCSSDCAAEKHAALEFLAALPATD
jgi:exosortase A